MIDTIRRLMEHDTAGDPMTGLRWTRRTTEKIADELASLGIDVCANTVAKLLKDLDYRLRVNHKKLSGQARPRPRRPVRLHRRPARVLRRPGTAHHQRRLQKRELVGNFKNAGATWCQQPTWSTTTTSAPRVFKSARSRRRRTVPVRARARRPPLP